MLASFDFLAKNLRYLRKQRNMNQREAATDIGFNQSTYNNYETGKSKPGLDDLLTIINYFDITASQLLESDLEYSGQTGNLSEIAGRLKNRSLGKVNSKLSGNLNAEKQPLSTSEPDAPVYHRLPQVVTIDSSGNENVVMVPVRARAGYLNGYADPQFIEKLPAYRLPGLNNGSYRIFEVEGVSMYPTLHDKDLVIGQYVEQWRDIRDDRVYVVVTKNDGLVVKRVINRLLKDRKLILKSDNYKDRDMFPPLVCDPENIVEIWYVTGFLSRQLRPPAETYNRVIDLEGRLTLMEDLYQKISGKLK